VLPCQPADARRVSSRHTGGVFGRVDEMDDAGAAQRASNGDEEEELEVVGDEAGDSDEDLDDVRRARRRPSTSAPTCAFFAVLFDKEHGYLAGAFREKYFSDLCSTHSARGKAQNIAIKSVIDQALSADATCGDTACTGGPAAINDFDCACWGKGSGGAASC